MASNRFGNVFTITTWGESHGKAIGVVIDGCPAGLFISDEEINRALAERAPGKSALTSPRQEPDTAEILSGVYEGQTTGAPISILIPNRDADSSKYDSLKNIYRPGHANFTYLEKYGLYDHRGGGRASARETACRVAAGAVAFKLLENYGVVIEAKLVQVGEVCDPDLFEKTILEAREKGDSIGGIVEFSIQEAPPGLGDPVYEKFEAMLAAAMLSIPATKGFEIGRGFGAASMCGSQHNDPFESIGGKVRTATNNSGGTLGGITTGMPVIGKVAFKPASSIAIEQKTVTQNGCEAKMTLPAGSRHDPCVAIRGAPVVKAMAALVVADSLLMNRSAV